MAKAYADEQFDIESALTLVDALGGKYRSIRTGNLVDHRAVLSEIRHLNAPVWVRHIDRGPRWQVELGDGQRPAATYEFLGH